MSDVTTEVVRRVYDDSEGVYLEVGPGPDGSGIAISTFDPKSVEWFGKVNLTMSEEMATALGNALVACALEGSEK